MVVLIVWLAVLFAAAVFLGVLAYGVFGQVRRLRRAIADARADVQPHLAALKPRSTGRHSAS